MCKFLVLKKAKPMATNLVSSPSVLVIYSIVKRVTNLVCSHVSVRLLNYIISNIPINLLNGWHLLFLLFMQTLLCRGAAIPFSAKFSVCEPCISPFLGIITMTTEDSAKFGVCAHVSMYCIIQWRAGCSRFMWHGTSKSFLMRLRRAEYNLTYV